MIDGYVYKQTAIDVHTGDRMLDYKLERELKETLQQYSYSKDHDHVR